MVLVIHASLLAPAALEGVGRRPVLPSSGWLRRPYKPASSQRLKTAASGSLRLRPNRSAAGASTQPSSAVSSVRCGRSHGRPFPARGLGRRSRCVAHAGGAVLTPGSAATAFVLLTPAEHRG